MLLGLPMAHLYRVLQRIQRSGPERDLTRGLVINPAELGLDAESLVQSGHLEEVPEPEPLRPQNISAAMNVIRDDMITRWPDAEVPNAEVDMARAYVERVEALTDLALAAEAKVIELEAEKLEIEKKLEAESQRAAAFEAEITKLQAPPAGQKGEPATDAEKAKPKGGK